MCNKNKVQEGYLHFPVHTLMDESARRFESLCDKYDLNYHLNKGLSHKLKLECTDDRICDGAMISNHFDRENNSYYQIHVWDNFCQFLWCICYSSIIFFDEIIIRPTIDGTYSGKFDKDNLKLNNALEVFRAGFSLFQSDSLKRACRGTFFDLPNPTQRDGSEAVEAANQLFINGMCFILFHEYSHFTLNHFGHTPISGDEYEADYNAFFSMYEECEQGQKKFIALGCVAVLGAIMFSDKTLQGGLFHPDPDDRLNAILAKIDNIDFYDADDCYGFATMLYKIWAYEHNLQGIIPSVSEVGCFKEYFEIIHKSFIQYKESL